jgi:hypothetical protein
MNGPSTDCRPRFFVSADWSKDPRKRSVHVADLSERLIYRKAQPDWALGSLTALARQLSERGSVLIGIDLVLGVPRSYWELVLAEPRYGKPAGFIHWLEQLSDSGSFFHPANTVRSHEDWRVHRPWFRVPKGHGSLTSFKKKADDGFLRLIDRTTGAKPLFIVSGIPGTVGSGTRDFWQELAAGLVSDRDFGIWPFDGPLPELLSTHGVVLAETYPGLAYAAAVLRCYLDGTPIVEEEWVDPIAEGSMLLAGPVDPNRKARALSAPGSRSAQAGLHLQAPLAPGTQQGIRRSQQPRHRQKTDYSCPIPGCTKVFQGSRGGWDAHVASPRKHLDWYPDVESPQVRKELFKKDFGNWFR